MREINGLLQQLLISEICGWRATCGVKWQHDTEEQAEEHARKLNSRPGRKPQEAYACGWCWHWHVGGKFNRGRLKYLIKVALLRSAKSMDRQEWKQ